MNRSYFCLIAVLTVTLFCSLQRTAAQAPELGGNLRPNYELYRVDKLVLQGDASHTGDLGLSFPLLVVPGRHGHDFEITLNYSSSITQRQQASWVGLGWSLDVGAVERSVQGRSDDQPVGLNGTCTTCNYNLGGDNSWDWRAEKEGRMNSTHPHGDHLNADQADMYRLIIDGSSIEILPFADAINGNTLSAFSFLPVQYRPWEIEADWPESQGPIRYFEVSKEDGTVYRFGYPLFSDVVSVSGRTLDNQYAQSFSFPYRWPLTSVQYPDGCVTSVKYNTHNYGQNKVRRRFETIPIDRSFAWQSNLFGAGNPLLNPDIWGYVDYAYSSPESLFTDTHVVMFRSSTPGANDSTDRNRRLDTLVLYDRATRTELKRVLFAYATDVNSVQEFGISGSAPDWLPNQKLNNNQLTLISVTT